MKTWRRVREAIDTYSFLCLSRPADDRRSPSRIHPPAGRAGAEHVTLGKTGQVVWFGTVGNVADDGSKQDSAHARTRYQRGNEMWHSDSSFRQGALLRLHHPRLRGAGEGGGTCFASMRNAYAKLPAEMQATIDPLHAIHDYVFSRSQVAPVDPAHAASLPPVEHKLVRTNPGNGLKSYYVGSHARSIVGWSGIESRRLLDDLLRRATAPEDVYTHQWRAGDTVIWDNRCLLHRGAGYDADRWRRRMRQTRVAGAGPTLEEP